eukprot:gb/GECG01013387.1/.p1 GENE.gb/GECG01013387.1/~~gb/GECG01013387.1/.p1  ORF type:complete len:559 (+),score=79.52 gb/GECG01013387.1/:1-1677(+)
MSERGEQPLIVQESIDRIRQNDPNYTATAPLFGELCGARLDDNDAQYIADALRLNTALRAIDLRLNQISDVGAHHLADALRTNSTLTSIGLAGNQISDAGIQSLADALRLNTTLIELDLADNKAGDIAARSLASTLLVNATVAEVHLNHNLVGDTGARSLADALRVNTALTDIDLRSNKISDTGMQSLANAVPANTTLNSIALEGNQANDLSLPNRIEHLVKENNKKQPSRAKREAAATPNDQGGMKAARVSSSTPNPSQLSRSSSISMQQQQQLRQQSYNASSSTKTLSPTAKDISYSGIGSQNQDVALLAEHMETGGDNIKDLRTKVLPYTNVSAYRHEIPRALEKEDEDMILMFIQTDSKLRPFYESMNAILCDYFIAAITVAFTEKSTSKTASTVNSLFSTLLHTLPSASRTSSTLNSVLKKHVAVDTVRAKKNLLAVAPTHEEIMQLVEHVTRRITLALKDQIDALDSAEQPIEFWGQLHDRIMCIQPASVYAEEGLAYGMAILKLCMEGDVNSGKFTAKNLLTLIGYDRGTVHRCIEACRSEALASIGSFFD